MGNFEIAQAKDISVEIDGETVMLQDAIDEGKVGGAIDDESTTATDKSWSAKKINDSLVDIESALDDKADADKVVPLTYKTTVTNANDLPDGFISANGLTNAPQAGHIFYRTFSYDRNSDYRVQEATLIGTTRKLIRHKNQGTWQSWQELATKDKVQRAYDWTFGKQTYATMEDFLIDMVNRGIIINKASNSVVISFLYSYATSPEITELNSKGFASNCIAGGCLYIDGIYSTDTSVRGNRLVIRFEGQDGNFVYLDNSGWGETRHIYRRYATK